LPTPIDSAVPQLRQYLCNNVFVQGGIAAAGYGTITGNLHPAVGLSAAAVSLGRANLCSNDGFTPNDHLPQPHPLVGGQCQASYLVVATVQYSNFQSSGTQTLIASSSPNVAGPVGGFRWTPFPLEDNGQPRQWSLAVVDANGVERGMGNAQGVIQLDYGPGVVVNSSATRQDGQPDNCGNLPGSAIAIVGSPDDVLPPGSITVPSPTGSGPSLTLPIANFKIEKLFGVDGPLVNFDVGGVTVKVDFGKEPPEVTDVSGDVERAIDRIEDELANQGDALAQEGQDNADILRYLETLSQLSQQIRDCTCRPEVELESLWIPYVQCAGEDTPPSELLAQVQVPKDTVGGDLIQALSESSDLAVLGCEGHPVYAVPDSFQQKRMFAPPVLVLVYRRGTTRGYNSYSIPNPASTDPDQSILLTQFRKGQTLGTAHFTDNSTIQVNCFDQSEAERVLDLLVPLVDGQFWSGGVEESFVVRRGPTVGTEEMRLTSYSYYADGNKNLRPTWIRRISGRP
jgi:hypothetical protein